MSDFITPDELDALAASGTGARKPGLAAMQTAVIAQLAKLQAAENESGIWVNVPDETVKYLLTESSKMTAERRAKLLVWRTLDAKDVKDDFAAKLDPEWDGELATLKRVGIIRRK